MAATRGTGVDLLHGADHSTARLEDVQVLCRRCHGSKDGGKQQRDVFFDNRGE
jgi:hypothetical protein